jgi:trehalose 6-phosphate phosphatase
MVIETRFHTATKGTAINDFLQNSVPAGGTLFAGDDVTDEDAFAMVNALNGSGKGWPRQHCRAPHLIRR